MGSVVRLSWQYNRCDIRNNVNGREVYRQFQSVNLVATVSETGFLCGLET
jgi:hypothetical protein